MLVNRTLPYINERYRTSPPPFALKVPVADSQVVPSTRVSQVVQVMNLESRRNYLIYILKYTSKNFESYRTYQTGLSLTTPRVRLQVYFVLSFSTANKCALLWILGCFNVQNMNSIIISML